MRIATIALLAALVPPFVPAAAQARPFENFFRYEEPRLPVAGDCEAGGGAAAWYGEYSGRRFDIGTDKYYPFAISGCFDSKLACQIWQQRAITYSVDGPITYTSCRRRA